MQVNRPPLIQVQRKAEAGRGCRSDGRNGDVAGDHGTRNGRASGLCVDHVFFGASTTTLASFSDTSHGVTGDCEHDDGEAGVERENIMANLE